eukprot:scaffold3825_cov225-Pinguiococcus_pyrenoidosus.AAC.4
MHAWWTGQWGTQGAAAESAASRAKYVCVRSSVLRTSAEVPQYPFRYSLEYLAGTRVGSTSPKPSHLIANSCRVYGRRCNNATLAASPRPPAPPPMRGLLVAACCQVAAGWKPVFVDTHCHLVHRRFPPAEAAAAIARASEKRVGFVVVNGLEAASNREVLEFCKAHPNALPACGIYPLDACANAMSKLSFEDFTPPAPWDVSAELKWLRERARAGDIVALGEVGLDRHYTQDEACLQEQEQVLREVFDIAVESDLPVILHTRKAESRVLEMLQEQQVQRAIFHCYMGKKKLAQRIAEAGYYISIPSAIARPHDTFVTMARSVPLERILTETDAPYMGPVKGERNEPATIPSAVQTIADVRGEAIEDVARQIHQNFCDVFGIRTAPESNQDLPWMAAKQVA